MVNIGNGWDRILAPRFNSPSYTSLREFLKEEYSHYSVYPNMHDIFNAFKLTPPESVKAVILGQDPYHGEGQAHGLAFSVKEGVPVPPSLKNIFKELHDDIGFDIPKSGCLTKWAQSGVLLLNTVLTVRADMAGSHRNKGWEDVTDAAVKALNESEKSVVFFLWGNFAREKRPLITNKRHLILTAPHPSPLSAYYGFFGCKHFSKCNEFLERNGMDGIDWNLT